MADGSDYEVGYRRPPRSGQFKKGRSGNPEGRRKGSKNFSTELQEELQEKISIRENGKVKRISKQRAMLKSLSVKAVQGDTKAAMALATFVHRHIQDADEPPAHASTPLSKIDAEILAEFEADIRRKAVSAPVRKSVRNRPVRTRSRAKPDKGTDEKSSGGTGRKRDV